MKAVLRYPRVDGSMLLGDILEFNAINNPDLPFFVFPDSSGGRRVLSHLDFYRASHRVAHLIHQRFREGEKVAVLARVDTILQHALTVGMILAGVIPVLMSFKIPADSVTNLLQVTSCRNLIVTRESLSDLVAGVAADFTAEGNLQIMDAPSVLQVYPELARHYGGEASFQKFDVPVKRPVLEDVMLYLHTSGSTGYPKPIRHTHQMFLNWCNQAPVADFKSLGKTIDLGTMALPAFHISGLYNQLYVPMGALTATCVYTPMSVEDPKALPTIPDAHNVLSCLKVTKANALVIYPAILELWTSGQKSAEALKVMQSLEYISYIGSALSPKSGRILLDAGVKFTGVYATSEIGALTASYLDDADWEHWQYVRFVDPSGVRWEKKSDRLYECQVLATDNLAVAVENLPDVRGYATSDLFEKHPTIEGLWKYVGRSKNLFIMSDKSGVMMDTIELAIAGNRYVRAVKAFQHQRRIGLLVEPSVEWYTSQGYDEYNNLSFLEAIWADVEAANESLITYSVINRDLIVVATKDKPLHLSAKGTVMDSSLEDYKREIDSLNLFTSPEILVA